MIVRVAVCREPQSVQELLLAVMWILQVGGQQLCWEGLSAEELLRSRGCSGAVRTVDAMQSPLFERQLSMSHELGCGLTSGPPAESLLQAVGSWHTPARPLLSVQATQGRWWTQQHGCCQCVHSKLLVSCTGGLAAHGLLLSTSPPGCQQVPQAGVSSSVEVPAHRVLCAVGVPQTARHFWFNQLVSLLLLDLGCLSNLHVPLPAAENLLRCVDVELMPAL